MIERLISTFRDGGFIIVYDGSHREAEADLMVYASFATPEKVRFLRQVGGGLICFATTGEVAAKLRLKYLADLLKKDVSARGLVISRTPYGDESAFSISLNHRRTYTGITDNDRSKTITQLARLVGQENPTHGSLKRNFYTPGHVPVLIARDVNERRGHTELAMQLCRLARLPPAAVMCEMLGEGVALPINEVKTYAKRHKIPFIEGSELIGGTKA